MSLDFARLTRERTTAKCMHPGGAGEQLGSEKSRGARPEEDWEKTLATHLTALRALHALIGERSQ